MGIGRTTPVPLIVVSEGTRENCNSIEPNRTARFLFVVEQLCSFSPIFESFKEGSWIRRISTSFHDETEVVEASIDCVKMTWNGTHEARFFSCSEDLLLLSIRRLTV